MLYHVLLVVAAVFFAGAVGCAIAVGASRDDDVDLGKLTQRQCLAAGSCRLWSNGVCRIGKKRNGTCTYASATTPLVLFVAAAVCLCCGLLTTGVALSARSAHRHALRRQWIAQSTTRPS